MNFNYFSRSRFMSKAWTRAVKNQQESLDMEDLTFSQAVDKAFQFVEPRLVPYEETGDSKSDSLSQLTKKLHHEVQQYFKTGNLGPTNKASFNPTLIHKDTSDWLVHRTSSPFNGYWPLPMKELMNDDENGIALRYCQAELKKLLIAFRKRVDDVKFFFHPIDPLVFCYGKSPLKFDLVDTLELADEIGLVNILNAAARVLRSEDSVLLTQTEGLPYMATDFSDYIHEVLCCPLSLAPSIYGFRLIDKIQLTAPDSPFPSTGLRWKKSSLLDGVPLVLSPALEKYLDRLKKACFHISPSGEPVHWKTCGLACYSPLTFRYVLNDLIRRSGFISPSAVMSAALSGLPPVFRKSLSVGQAWMERRPVWKVKVGVDLGDLAEESLEISQVSRYGTPALHMILVPFSFAEDPSASTMEVRTNLNSTENHFIENLDMKISKLEHMGLSNRIDFSFLLEDRSLLDTHFGAVVDDNAAGCPLFFIPHFGEPQCSVELFNEPYPWPWDKSPSLISHPLSSSFDKSPQLIGESCKESKKDYVIRVKIQASHQHSFSGS